MGNWPFNKTKGENHGIMLDFVKVVYENNTKHGDYIYPDFIVKRSQDLMIRGKDFYAVWDEENNIWSTSEDRVFDLIDEMLYRYADENGFSHRCVRSMRSFKNDQANQFHKYVQKVMRDNYHELDTNVIFKSQEVKKTDYVTKRLDYDMEDGPIDAYEQLIGTLFAPEEKEKLEWAVGSIIAGDSKNIQKFIVLYGDPGTGKSTWIDLVCAMFPGDYGLFDAKSLASQNNQFALEAFKDNPLIAIQHDGDLSQIADNTKLNSIISHESMLINEKFKSQYKTKFHSFLIMGTNTPVYITGSRSGMNRRLIDVRPTGDKLPRREYDKLKKQMMQFEIGAIAKHCYDVYMELGHSYYDSYVATDMKEETDDFYNFMVDDYFDIVKETDGCQISDAWARYKTYCEEMGVKYPFPYRKFKAELKEYFENYDERIQIGGSRMRKYLSGIKLDKLGLAPAEKPKKEKKEIPEWLQFKEQPSKLDILCAECPAQEATADGIPKKSWDKVQTILKDICSNNLHYVRIPIEHIVIDFDLKDENGEKSLQKNLEAAAMWPKTYAELSKSGKGIHLHYIYTGGDPNELARLYADSIEIKVYTGKSALRRQLTLCNDLDISTISSGLPLREVKKNMVSSEVMYNENIIRRMIKNNLEKKYHGATKPSVDYIYKILDDAYANSVKYDVTDMRPAILAFAANSTNQSQYCIALVDKMHFKSDEPSEFIDSEDERFVFYDVEVFPNLFLINWKFAGADQPINRMINPTPTAVKELFKYRLIGFNCRRYDNHILWARSKGYTNEELFRLSQRIINTKKGENNNCFFGEAYNLSYTDIYDFSSRKQSLKKWEIDLGIHHKELGLPWDQPVPENRWIEVAEYCDNDVIATEAVFNCNEIQGDFNARLILAQIAGGSPNDTTNSLTTKFIFQGNKNPELNYTDLSELFPGYEYVEMGADGHHHNMFMGEDVGFGGYVYAQPGMYGRTVCFDVASMHPSSVIALDMFGEYTQRFKDILDARIAVKHNDVETLKTIFGGELLKYCQTKESRKVLAQALKIAINSVYGLTSAGFANAFKDPRNKNNIVALRGALFMVTLKHEVEKRGFKVAHIKTDSIKIVEPDERISNFVIEFGKQYGYNFEIEHIFEKICLVNDAVYISKLADDDPEYSEKVKEAETKNTLPPTPWLAVGTQFQVPYVFKTLFSHEEITFADLCEAKTVKDAMYLDMNEKLKEDEHEYVFIGKVGLFCPMKEGSGGGELVRENSRAGSGYSYVTGSKGYRWMEAETVKQLGKEDDIDLSYYESLCEEAIKKINEVENGDYNYLVGLETDQVAA